MLDGEAQSVLAALQIVKHIGPGEDVAGSPQALAMLTSVHLLPGMVDQCDGGLVPPLQGAQVSQDGGEFLRAILISRVQSDQRVEEEQPGPVELRKYPSGRVMGPDRGGIAVTESGESVGKIRWKGLQGAREARIMALRADGCLRNCAGCGLADPDSYAPRR